MTDGAICGPRLPETGSRVPMRRLLHDDGFGHCFLRVSGLYGKRAPIIFASFVAFQSDVWHPTELRPRRLSWVERKVSTWDEVWPKAKWTVSLAWPFQSEEWERREPGVWVVTKASARGIAG